MEQRTKPHILILPFPAQGHIKPMLCLTELLCHAGLCVTFLNTDHINRHLVTNLQLLTTRFPTLLHFDSISDGLPHDHPRSGNRFVELISALKNTTKPLFRKFLVSLHKRCPVTCVIVDGVMMSVAIDVAEELGIRFITFRTTSATCLWAYFCLPELIAKGQVPFQDDNMDKEIALVEGMEGIFRRRDLPSNYRSKTIDDPILNFFIEETLSMTRASCLILNTFDDLEAPVLSQLATLFPKIYTIGPLHSLLNSKIPYRTLPQQITDQPKYCYNYSSMRKPDYGCIKWLDSKPPKSVLYVSFGSFLKISGAQFQDFWHGLVNSGQHFLWVVRTDAIEDGDKYGLRIGTQEKGCIVEWAPQEEVLAHPAIGGFLTHSGWNSCMEAIVAGVPLICWPQLGDQTLNSRLVGSAWRIGLDMKDTCDVFIVEKMVRSLMVDHREEIVKSVERFKGLALDSVSQGGSSWNHLERLIQQLNCPRF